MGQAATCDPGSAKLASLEALTDCSPTNRKGKGGSPPSKSVSPPKASWETGIPPDAIEEYNDKDTGVACRRLNVSHESIGPVGAHTIANTIYSNTGKVKLKQIIIQFDSIGDAGLKELVDVIPRVMEILDVRGNGITDVGLAAFRDTVRARDKSNKNPLEELNLNNNNFSRHGLEALMSALPATKVQTLYLDDNNIDHKGAHVLAKHSLNCDLRKLSLYRNNIGDAGAAFFVEELPKKDCRIERLDLRSNGISREKSQELRVAANEAAKKRGVKVQILGLQYTACESED
jgi:hypothetical protein